MSYNSPSDSLDEKEICNFLNLTKQMGLSDLINYIWKQGYEWGYERGFEDGNGD